MKRCPEVVGEASPGADLFVETRLLPEDAKGRREMQTGGAERVSKMPGRSGLPRTDHALDHHKAHRAQTISGALWLDPRGRCVHRPPTAQTVRCVGGEVSIGLQRPSARRRALNASVTASTTRSRCEGVIPDPLGRQRPVSNRRSVTAPPNIFAP